MKLDKTKCTDEIIRRLFYGEFFTPLKFAKKALEYLEKIIGKNWWKTGEYRLWDMAAGTGNLQYHLPVDALEYCYLSTIYKEDVEHCEKLFPNAICFQYDYLNDDINDAGNIDYTLTNKIPESLRKAIREKKKILFLIKKNIKKLQRS